MTQDDKLPPPPGYEIRMGQPSIAAKELMENLRCRGQDHVWMWDASAPIPEGLACECGEIIAHYESCPLCQSKRLTGRSAKGLRC